MKTKLLLVAVVAALTARADADRSADGIEAARGVIARFAGDGGAR